MLMRRNVQPLDPAVAFRSFAGVNAKVDLRVDAERVLAQPDHNWWLAGSRGSE